MVAKSATKKRLMNIGFPEVMAHYLADEMKWSEWLDLPKVTNSGISFEKHYYERIKQGLKKLELFPDLWVTSGIDIGDEELVALETNKHIMAVALFNDNVVDVAYNMIHSLPILTPDAKFPDLPSQGLFNWVSFEGEPYQKKDKMQYTQALGLFNLVLYEYNRKKISNHAYFEGDKAKRNYEDWLKRNERYRPENRPLNPYNPSRPYDYRKTPMQRTNQYDWNSPNARSPQFDFANPQFKKEYDKYQKMYQDYTLSSLSK